MLTSRTEGIISYMERVVFYTKWIKGYCNLVYFSILCRVSWKLEVCAIEMVDRNKRLKNANNFIGFKSSY